MNEFIEVHDNIYTSKGFAELKGELENGAKTLLEGFLKNCEKFPNKKSLGKIFGEKVVYKTFSDLKLECEKLASFLETITMEKDIVGIYSINRIEWIISEYSIYFANCTTCPLFSNFSTQSLLHVLNETEMKTILCAASNVSHLIENVLSLEETCKLKNIIIIDEDKSLKELVEKKGLNCFFLCDILKQKNCKTSRMYPKPEDLATICYTSGTSGLPKGVMLTHYNFISQIESFYIASEKYDIISFDCEKVYISYLPLAHVLERLVFTIAFFKCTYIAFYNGNPKNLQADLKIIKPSFITVVPRVLNVFKNKIEEKINELSFLKRTIAKIGIKWKLFMIGYGYTSSWFWDKLVFNKIAKEFGGNIVASLCGGASINKDVIDYMQVVLSAKIFQGYGQTEGIAANIVSTMHSVDSMSVGIPFVSTQVKLVPGNDLPASTGHLLMRGPSIMKGYYKREDLTKKAFEKGGWLVTGDIAKYENGKFYIVGRSKDIFKTSFGEYITPEVLENDFVGGEIDDIYITHSVDSDYLLAIVVCTNDSFTVEDIAKKIKEKGSTLVAEKKIARYEIPSHFILLNQPFTSFNEGNLITPSLKKKRQLFEKYFADEISKAFKIKY